MKRTACFAIAAIAASSCFAADTYNNLGPCNGVNSFSGSLISWPDFLFGYHLDMGAQFTAGESGSITSIRIALSSILAPDLATFQLYSDAGDALV